MRPPQRPRPRRTALLSLLDPTLAFLLALSLAPAVALVGCGSSEPSQVEVPVASSGGGSSGGEAAEPEQAPTEPEQVAEAPLPAEPLSYRAESHRVMALVDLERVRGTSVGPDIASMVRSYPRWQELLGSSGIDPMRDFDRVLFVADDPARSAGFLIIRHHLSVGDIRARVLRLASEAGTQPRWREVEGFQVADWPVQTRQPRVLVVTAEGELVVCRPEDVPAVVRVARDHQRRREALSSAAGAAGAEAAGPAPTIEPAMQMAEGELARMRGRGMSEQDFSASTRSMLASRGGMPQDIDLSFTQGSTEIEMHLVAAYADAAAAQVAREQLGRELEGYGNQLMVRAVGLDRPLREARWTQEDNGLSLRMGFTSEEARRAMGLFALRQQLTQGR